MATCTVLETERLVARETLDYVSEPIGPKRVWSGPKRALYALALLTHDSHASISKLSRVSGVPRWTLWHVLTGRRRPSLATLTRLATALKLDMTHINNVLAIERERRRQQIAAGSATNNSRAAAGQTPPAVAGPHPENAEPASPTRGGEQAEGRGTLP